MSKDDPKILEASLIGFRQQIAEINAKIAEVQARLNGSRPPEKQDVPPKKRRRRMSAEGRARIAAAQRKRWAVKKKAEVKSDGKKAAA